MAEHARSFFFGEAERRLLGVFHPSAGQAAPSTAVVLCYPFGDEYMRAHRWYVQLAQRLAERGVPALRFDFFGCGDSWGECQEGHLGQWIDDAKLAGDEALARSGARELCLLGMRLGAAICMLAAERLARRPRLVLWDPVIDGEKYLAELRGVQRDFLDAGLVGSPSDAATEVLGFPLPAVLEREISQVEARKLADLPASEVLLLESAGTSEVQDLAAAWESNHVPVTTVGAPSARAWSHELNAGPAQDLACMRAVNALVGWVEANCA